MKPPRSSRLVTFALLTWGCASEPAAPATESAAQPEASTAAQPEASAAPQPEASAAPQASAATEPAPSPSASSPLGISAPSSNPDTDLAREAALRKAREIGMIGLLNGGTADFAADAGLAKGNLWGDEIGEAYGVGGLGLRGTGVGTGRGEAVGLGNLGTIGRGGGTGSAGFGSGGLGGAAGSKPPKVRIGATTVGAGLAPEVVQRIVRARFGRLRACYESGLKSSPELAGEVIVDFVVSKNGAVSSVATRGDLPNQDVAACVKTAFETLSFPTPDGVARVAVQCPIRFTPGESGPKTDASSKTDPSSKTPAPKSPETIDGKSLEDVTGLEVERALRAAGATDVSSTTVPGREGVLVFTAKRGGKTFTLTFVPAQSAELSREERARLRTGAALFERGRFVLAVESDDRAASQSLLDILIQKP